MTDDDLTGFFEEFRRVVRVFPFRGSPEDVQRTQRDYFAAFRACTLEQVRGGVDNLLATRDNPRFPRPVEWKAAMPAAAFAGRHLSEAEAHDYSYAEMAGVRFVGDPCDCAACVAAGVSDQPIRFVPDFNDEQAVKVFHPMLQRVVDAGHWAHGAELARWYAAAARVQAAWRAWAGTHTAKAPPLTGGFQARLDAIFARKADRRGEAEADAPARS